MFVWKRPGNAGGNGKWLMRSPWFFVQPSDSKGGWVDKYSYQPGFGGDPNRAQPVNYKP